MAPQQAMAWSDSHRMSSQSRLISCHMSAMFKIFCGGPNGQLLSGNVVHQLIAESNSLSAFASLPIPSKRKHSTFGFMTIHLQTKRGQNELEQWRKKRRKNYNGTIVVDIVEQNSRRKIQRRTCVDVYDADVV